MHKSGKTRSRTGCRSCRIRKVKCDEEKVQTREHKEPQCRRCLSARILCEWKGGPIPRRSTRTSSSRCSKIAQKDEDSSTSNHSHLIPARDRSHQPITSYSQKSLLAQTSPSISGQNVQAANSLTLSGFDRECLNYLQDSVMVLMLGKHWPWSTVSYTYHKIAPREPMVMSMILASTAGEICRIRLYNMEDSLEALPGTEQSDMDGRVHYGRALSGLRESLKQDVKSPQQIEAIFITLWLMIDYENRFGSGASAINIHTRGIETLLHNHIVPLLQSHKRPTAIMDSGDNIPSLQQPEPHIEGTSVEEYIGNPDAIALAPSPESTDGLGGTCVPLFLLWTLYFFTPAALFFGSETARLDTDIFRFFLRSENGSTALSLPGLYRLSRQSPAHFWGDIYPVASQLDDLENLPGLALYHRSHVVQFKITEMFKLNASEDISLGEGSTYQKLVKEINALAVEYDTALTSAKRSSSCDVPGDRRVMETVYWAAITYYGTIVYFHLCFENLAAGRPDFQKKIHNLLPLAAAVSIVLELSLKLHRSRPRLLVRITWPLFIAGIATSDRIYQDWVSIRLRELGRYGQNYDRISRRYDEISRGGHSFFSKGNGNCYLAT